MSNKFKLGDRVHAVFSTSRTVEEGLPPHDLTGEIVEPVDLFAVLCRGDDDIAVRSDTDDEIYYIKEDEAEAVDQPAGPITGDKPAEGSYEARFNATADALQYNHELIDSVHTELHNLAEEIDELVAEGFDSVRERLQRIETKLASIESNQSERDSYRKHMEEIGMDYDSRIERLENPRTHAATRKFGPPANFGETITGAILGTNTIDPRFTAAFDEAFGVREADGARVGDDDDDGVEVYVAVPNNATPRARQAAEDVRDAVIRFANQRGVNVVRG